MRKRIQKFQNPAGGITATPGTWNTGFNLSQQIGSQDLLPIPQIGGQSFAQAFPEIDLAAITGDPMAMKLKTDNTFMKGLQMIKEAGTLKSPFSGKPLETTATSGNSEDSDFKTPFSETKAGRGIAVAGQAMNILGDALSNLGIADYKQNGNTDTRKSISAAGRQVASMFGPWGQFAAGLDSITEGLGGKSDVSEGLGAADTGNMIASIALPGLGWALGKTDKYSQDQMIKTSSAYTGEAAAGEKVAKNAGAKLLFGRGKANENTRLQKLRDADTKKVLQHGRDQLAASNYSGFSIGNQMALSGGPRVLRAEDGIKLKLKQARRILKNAYVEELPEIAEVVEEFKEGGKVNVIPEGSLHKNRHHMETVSDSFKELTHKGIPVVTESKGGLVQQAEIERNEIIFNIDVTKKLEALMGDGSDEAALEAGKLLAFEIMENTVDNTGLIDEIS